MTASLYHILWMLNTTFVFLEGKEKRCERNAAMQNTENRNMIQKIELQSN